LIPRANTTAATDLTRAYAAPTVRAAGLVASASVETITGVTLAVEATEATVVTIVAVVTIVSVVAVIPVVIPVAVVAAGLSFTRAKCGRESAHEDTGDCLKGLPPRHRTCQDAGSFIDRVTDVMILHRQHLEPSELKVTRSSNAKSM
jgi:hypothetical protein